MPRILVIGGTEHIGKSLCIELLKNLDNQIICLDNPGYALDLSNDRFVYRSRDLLWLNTSDVSVNIDFIYYIFCDRRNYIELIRALDIAHETGAKLVLIAVTDTLPLCARSLDGYMVQCDIIYTGAEPDMSLILQHVNSDKALQI